MCDSDSDDEGVLTNVNKLVIRPPGHTGKAKKGHICFDSGYETMNLGRVDFISDQEYDLYIRPDTGNPRHRLWFYFTIDNTQAHQKVIFNFINLSKFRLLFRDGLTPVVKSTSRPFWQRLPREDVFYYKSSIHSDRYVLSFVFCFDLEEEKYHLAFSQPYSFSRLKLYTENLLACDYDYLRVETLCQTVDKRDCLVLTISDPCNFRRVHPRDTLKKHKGDDTGDDVETDELIEDDNQEYLGDKIRAVVFLFRQNPCDSPTSFIAQGLVDFLVSEHSVAKALRKKLVFKIVPLMNPDGVYYGNSKGNAVGQDLNRLWHKSNSFTTPTIHAVKKMLLSLDKTNILDIVLDVHAHETLLGLAITGNSYSDVYRFERYIVFPKFLAKNCQEMRLEDNKYNDDILKEGTARKHLASILSSEVNVYALEVSFYGYKQKDRGEEDIVVPFSQEGYYRIGRNICRAVWDYYKIIGFIPMDNEDVPSVNFQKPSLNSFNLLRLREIDQQREEMFSLDIEREIYDASASSDSSESEDSKKLYPNDLRIGPAEGVDDEDCENHLKKKSIQITEHVFDDSEFGKKSMNKNPSVTLRIPPRHRKYGSKITHRPDDLLEDFRNFPGIPETRFKRSTKDMNFQSANISTPHEPKLSVVELIKEDERALFGFHNSPNAKFKKSKRKITLRHSTN